MQYFPVLCSYLLYSDPDMKTLINPGYEAQILTDKTFFYQSLQISINVMGNNNKNIEFIQSDIDSIMSKMDMISSVFMQ